MARPADEWFKLLEAKHIVFAFVAIAIAMILAYLFVYSGKRRERTDSYSDEYTWNGFSASDFEGLKTAFERHSKDTKLLRAPLLKVALHKAMQGTGRAYTPEESRFLHTKASEAEEVDFTEFCHLVSCSELHKYKLIFDRLDTRGKGRITRQRFRRKVGSVIGRDPGDEEVLSFLSKLGNKHNETIDFDDFVRILEKTKHQTGRLTVRSDVTRGGGGQRRAVDAEGIFRAIDTNQNGEIGARDLQACMENIFGKTVEIGRCEKLIRMGTTRAKDTLAIDEFRQLISTWRRSKNDLGKKLAKQE